jgi:hypothetical protein
LIYIAIRALNYRYIHIPIITNNYRKLPAKQLCVCYINQTACRVSDRLAWEKHCGIGGTHISVPCVSMLLQSGAEDLSLEADTVLKLLVKMGVEGFSIATVRNKTRGQKALERTEQMEAVFEELGKEGYIRLNAQQPIGSGSAGRPFKPLFELNPALTQPKVPSVYQKELVQGMRRIISQDLQTYTQADEAGKERMRKMYVSMQQKLEDDSAV